MGQLKLLAAVQARMGSVRLPGKSLMPVHGGMCLLEMVLRRVQAARSVDAVARLTSERPDCDPLEALARSLGVPVVRGDEQDVLSRFLTALDRFHPFAVVRVCADNPLVSPQEIDRLASLFFETDCAYAANCHFESGLPDGLGCEIFRAEALRVAARAGGLRDKDREHVTSLFRDAPESHRLCWQRVPKALHCPTARLDIDTEADLRRLRTFCAGLPEQDAPLWTSEQIVAALRAEGAPLTP